MECQQCSKKPATVFMTTVVGGELKRTDLCEDCARSTGALQPSGLLNEEVFLEKTSNQKTGSSLSCPSCGYTVEGLQKTGRLGCHRCYEVFAAALESALLESHKSLIHLGKRPQRAQANQAELDLEMKHLIATENFEEAARLRDRLSKKETGKPSKDRSY